MDCDGQRSGVPTRIEAMGKRLVARADEELAAFIETRSSVRSRLHWSDAHGLEKDSLPVGVAGAQSRHEITSAFVAQSLLSPGPFARLARRHARSPGAARCAE